ncbi:MAG: hypothetical protein HN348_01940 [Proteobacteria bacterium]|jgi:hypothetical protein|nr:hypothetical protein [Pseudomonadota bacterium]
MEAIGISLVLFVLICIPILSLSGGLVVTSIAKQYFLFRHKELELRRWQAEHAFEQARISSTMPPWLDQADAVDVAAWRSALAETVRLTAGRIPHQ